MTDFNESEYRKLQVNLSEHIRTSKARAALAVNSELILLYWQIGQYINNRQAKQSSEFSFEEQVAADLQTAFPKTKMFTPARLKHMRAFAETWSDAEYVQQVVAQLPWGHITCIIDEVSELNARSWYVQAAIKHGWNQSILRAQIEVKAHLESRET